MEACRRDPRPSRCLGARHVRSGAHRVRADPRGNHGSRVQADGRWGVEGEIFRRVLAPLFFTVATRFEIGRRFLFRTVSQVRIHYPQSALSEGKAGHVHGGDRLPWTGDSGVDNFAPLQSFDWQLHVYGTATAGLNDACQRLNLPLHEFAWNDAAERAGLKKDAFYVVRPDGYVGLASATQDVAALKTYVRSRGVRV
jgi:hypothetical protein